MNTGLFCDGLVSHVTVGDYNKCRITLVIGTFSVAYLVSFVAVKAHQWGFHMNFQGENDVKDIHHIYIPGKWSIRIRAELKISIVIREKNLFKLVSNGCW